MKTDTKQLTSIGVDIQISPQNAITLIVVAIVPIIIYFLAKKYI